MKIRKYKGGRWTSFYVGYRVLCEHSGIKFEKKFNLRELTYYIGMDDNWMIENIVLSISRWPTDFS